MWPDESGVLVTTYGALLPDGYKLDDSEPGRPWICPVRSCRRLFDLARNLGHHFTVSSETAFEGNAT
ncbi:hypothetical protein GE09DRAFT_1091064 [Coniochaeta sp. 2T2.1]|nr:hypothetical protein GE09DRAFT_1091064 [Coniochaeta sp. 2T2.1]